MGNMETEGYMEHVKHLKNYQNHCQHIIIDVDNALEELDKLEKEVSWKWYLYTWSKNDVISSVRKHYCALGLELDVELG